MRTYYLFDRPLSNHTYYIISHEEMEKAKSKKKIIGTMYSARVEGHDTLINKFQWIMHPAEFMQELVEFQNVCDDNGYLDMAENFIRNILSLAKVMHYDSNDA